MNLLLKSYDLIKFTSSIITGLLKSKLLSYNKSKYSAVRIIISSINSVCVLSVVLNIDIMFFNTEYIKI